MRIDAQQTAARLLQHDNIMLVCHRDPDADALGSTAALFDALTALGKRAGVFCSTPSPENLAFLKRPAPDFEPDFIVAVDTASVKQIGDGDLRKMPVNLCIDHHPSNELYAAETFLTTYAATGEAIIEILAVLNAPISADMATALFAAISSDTGSFKYSSVTANTFRCGAQLLEAGADHNLVRTTLYESKSPAEVQVESTALANCEFFSGGKIAVIVVTLELLARFGAHEDELEGLSAKPIQIKGVDIAITMKERADKSVRISVRTSENADACAICQAFEGGGHLRASGCRIFGTVAEAKAKVVAEAQKQV